MKRHAKWILATVLLAVVFHIAAVLLAPRIIMKVARGRIIRRAHGVNHIYNAPPVTPRNNDVVMQSPDILYSACAFDVSRGAVLLSSVMPRGYWSLSLYDMDTRNFFVVNDRQVVNGSYRLVLMGNGRKSLNVPGVRMMTVPVTRGVALFRFLITDQRKIENLIKIQKKTVCEQQPELTAELGL